MNNIFLLWHFNVDPVRVVNTMHWVYRREPFTLDYSLFTLRIIAVTTYLTIQSSFTVSEMLYYIPLPNYSFTSYRMCDCCLSSTCHITYMLSFEKYLESLSRHLRMQERQKERERVRGKNISDFFLYVFLSCHRWTICDWVVCDCHYG